MAETLKIHQDGVVSVAQMPHENGGYLHILASPSSNSVLYFVAHRPNRRTKVLKLLSQGYRKLSRAFEKFYTELRRYKDKFPKWDPMGGKVQKWDQEYVDCHFSHERLTKDQMLALVYRVCGERKIEVPQIIFVKKATFCYFKRCENSVAYVVMSEYGEMCNTGFVLHELAHLMADLYSKNIDNHGPLFVREYLRLLRDFTTVDIKVLQEGCRKHKVRYWNP